ncbi:hypothetical protein J7E73_04115 [Paenibacillus albidus]|uniref:hypothetical protein n=1 Tax=Paenibacillus albidus TaxID=2041023 RepID=UPI001BE80617|nr:hypothetical protein [Paenibacillus albidus]MBT2288327.1 hypothetical protein [Paenibacillus albidus]
MSEAKGMAIIMNVNYSELKAVIKCAKETEKEVLITIFLMSFFGLRLSEILSLQMI